MASAGSALTLRVVSVTAWPLLLVAVIRRLKPPALDTSGRPEISPVIALSCKPLGKPEAEKRGGACCGWASTEMKVL